LYIKMKQEVLSQGGDCARTITQSTTLPVPSSQGNRVSRVGAGRVFGQPVLCTVLSRRTARMGMEAAQYVLQVSGGSRKMSTGSFKDSGVTGRGPCMGW
jgi:hypothetical protein